MSRNKIKPPPGSYGQLIGDSRNATKNSTPSFNDKFIQQSKQVGYARPNKYLILIYPNHNVQQGLGMRLLQDTGRLATTCKSVNMNEQTWYTSEQQDLVAGSSRIFPYRRNTNNANGIKLQFNCGADMFEKEFFDSWMRYMQDPFTKKWRYYDDYAKGSEVYLLLLPNNIANFEQATAALFSGDSPRVSGYRFTEVYPYSLGVNGGALNNQSFTDPLYLDIGLMYHDVVQLRDVPVAKPEAITPVTETGFPVIDNTWAKKILNKTPGFSRAYGGFSINSQSARLTDKVQGSALGAYKQELDENQFIPRAVDGLVVQPPPGNGALDLGLTLLSQTQGFFGVGFFGNGFNP